MIKILYRVNKATYDDKAESPWVWADFMEGRKRQAKYSILYSWIEELVDKGNWTIIAATTEYIILQKQTSNTLPKMPKVTKSLIKGDVVELPSIEGAEEPETPQ